MRVRGQQRAARPLGTGDGHPRAGQWGRARQLAPRAVQSGVRWSALPARPSAASAARAPAVLQESSSLLHGFFIADQESVGFIFHGVLELFLVMSP